MHRPLTILALLSLGIGLTACSSSSVEFFDGGRGDGGVGRDASRRDVSSPDAAARDASSRDASRDAFVRDASSRDASRDASAGDAGSSTCGGRCVDPNLKCCPGCGPGEGLCIEVTSPCPDLACRFWESCEAAWGVGQTGDRCAGDFACSLNLGDCCHDRYRCVDGRLDIERRCECDIECERNADCGGGGFCNRDELCGGVGRCDTRPRDCPTDCPGVCGCNGAWFCNECSAHAAGVSIDAEGDCASPPPPTCEAQDVEIVGACSLFLGAYWNGRECVTAGGCECRENCDALFESVEACERVHADCRARFCGGLFPSRCEPDEFCNYDGDLCNGGDRGGVCQPRPERCDRTDDPVCGCDGRTYLNECVAQLNGSDVAHAGPCEDVPDEPPPEP